MTTLLYDNLSLLGFSPGNIDLITSVKYNLKTFPKLLQMFRFQHRLYLFLFDKIDASKAAKDFKHLQELLDKSSELEFKKLLKQWLLNLGAAAGLPRLMPRFFVSPRLCDLVELFLCLSLHALLLEQQRLFGLSPSDPILIPASGRADPIGLRLLESEAAELCRQAAGAAAARCRLADASRRLGCRLAQQLRALSAEAADLQREIADLREAAREAAVSSGSPLPGRSAPCESDEHCRRRAARLARCQPVLAAAYSAAGDALATGRSVLDAERVQLDRQLPPLPTPVALSDCLAKRLAATDVGGGGGGVEVLTGGRVRLAALLRVVRSAVLPGLAEPWLRSSSSSSKPDRQRLASLVAALRASEREAAALANSLAEQALPELALLADKHRLVWTDADEAGRRQPEAADKSTAAVGNHQHQLEVVTSPLHGNTPLRRGSGTFTPAPSALNHSRSNQTPARVRFLDLSDSEADAAAATTTTTNDNAVDSATAMEIEQLMASCDQLFAGPGGDQFNLLNLSG